MPESGWYRELTGLLFALIPYPASHFSEQRNSVFTGGGVVLG